MNEAHLSVSWDAYQKNICGGLSLFQQRSEFVDMTLAADGHHVKVHQMVLSLVSPYIKDLISTAQCPHPVIFLNNISYTTLCSILEYVYTGEVRVPKEQLADLVAAGRALHIKGLQQIDNPRTFQDDTSLIPLDDDDFHDSDNHTTSTSPAVKELNEVNENETHSGSTMTVKTLLQPICKVFVDKQSPIKRTDDECTDMKCNSENQNEEVLTATDGKHTSPQPNKEKELLISDISVLLQAPPSSSVIMVLATAPKFRKFETIQHDCLKKIQYSLSNQGGLQIIFNRYIYTLKYVQKNMIRSWRCADHAYLKCRAIIYTCEKNNVVKRLHSHNHRFHDEKIVKKISRGLIFSAYNEAEIKALEKKTEMKNESVGSHQAPTQDGYSD